MALALLFVGCNPVESFGTAERATEVLYDRMAKGQVALIHSESTEGFRKVTDLAFFAGVTARLNRKLGACSAATTVSKNVTAFPTGVFVTLNKQRNCTGGVLSERISWQILGGQAKLVGYNANSPVLAVD